MENCVSCKKKIIYGKTLLADGNPICPICMFKIPNEIHDYAMTHWGKQEVEDYMAYRSYSSSVLEPIFTRTNKIGKFVIDRNHHIFKFGDMKTCYYINSIEDVRFAFEPNTNTIINGKYIIGTSKIIMKCNRPLFEAVIVIDNKDKAFIYNSAEGKSLRLSNSLLKLKRELEEEIYMSSQIHSNYKEKQNTESNKQNAESNKTDPLKRGNSDYIWAMNLFMLDSLDNVTKDELRHLRNKFLKTFHPDEGEEENIYSQKINDAYNILVERMK